MQNTGSVGAGDSLLPPPRPLPAGPRFRPRAVSLDGALQRRNSGTPRLSSDDAVVISTPPSLMADLVMTSPNDGSLERQNGQGDGSTPSSPAHSTSLLADLGALPRTPPTATNLTPPPPPPPPLTPPLTPPPPPPPSPPASLSDNHDSSTSLLSDLGDDSIDTPNLKLKNLLGGKNVNELKKILQDAFKDDKYMGNSYGIFNKFFQESAGDQISREGFFKIFNDWAEEKIQESYKKRLIFAIGNSVLLAVAVIVGVFASPVAGYSLGLVSGIVFGFLEATSKRNIQTLGHLRESLADKIGKAVEKTKVIINNSVYNPQTIEHPSIDNSKKYAGISRGLSYFSGLAIGFVSFVASRIEAMSTFATGLSYAIPVVSLITLGLSFLNNYFRKKHAESKKQIFERSFDVCTDDDVEEFKTILKDSDSQGKTIGDDGYKKIQSNYDPSKLITAGNYASSKISQQFSKQSTQAKAVIGEDITESQQNEIHQNEIRQDSTTERKKSQSKKSTTLDEYIDQVRKQKHNQADISDHVGFSADMNNQKDGSNLSVVMDIENLSRLETDDVSLTFQHPQDDDGGGVWPGRSRDTKKASLEAGSRGVPEAGSGGGAGVGSGGDSGAVVSGGGAGEGSVSGPGEGSRGGAGVGSGGDSGAVVSGSGAGAGSVSGPGEGSRGVPEAGSRGGAGVGSGGGAGAGSVSGAGVVSGGGAGAGPGGVPEAGSGGGAGVGSGGGAGAGSVSGPGAGDVGLRSVIGAASSVAGVGGSANQPPRSP